MNEQFDWPMFSLIDDIRPHFFKLLERGEKVVIATLADAAGSSPRPLGSQMLVSEGGEVFGYVSGGCIESNLLEFSKEVIKEDKPRKLTFGHGSPYMDIQLLCGKRIDLTLDIIKPTDKAAEKLFALEKQRKSALWVGDVATSEHFCIDFADKEALSALRSKYDLPEFSGQALAGLVDTVYWKLFIPRLRLVVNGGNPVVMALLKLVPSLGWEIVLNRESGPLLPAGVKVDHYRRGDGAKLFAEFVPDEATAVVSLTHDIEADHDIIKHALPSPAFYVGVLGSKKHMPARERLMKRENIGEETMARLSAPIGLDIGASTANEIAVSIVGDIVKSFRK